MAPPAARRVRRLRMMAVMVGPPCEVRLLHARIQQQARDAQLKAAQRATASNNSVVNATNIVIPGRALFRREPPKRAHPGMTSVGNRPSSNPLLHFGTMPFLEGPGRHAKA